VKGPKPIAPSTSFTVFAAFLRRHRGLGLVGDGEVLPAGHRLTQHQQRRILILSPHHANADIGPRPTSFQLVTLPL